MVLQVVPSTAIAKDTPPEPRREVKEPGADLERTPASTTWQLRWHPLGPSGAVQLLAEAFVVTGLGQYGFSPALMPGGYRLDSSYDGPPPLAARVSHLVAMSALAGIINNVGAVS